MALTRLSKSVVQKDYPQRCLPGSANVLGRSGSRRQMAEHEHGWGATAAPRIVRHAQRAQRRRVSCTLSDRSTVTRIQSGFDRDSLAERVADAQVPAGRGLVERQRAHGVACSRARPSSSWADRRSQRRVRHADFGELSAARTSLDTEISAWAAALTEEKLNAPYMFVSPVLRVTRVQPTWSFVTHMFNHQTHHRGQLTTLLSQAGIDPGVTDVLLIPQLE
jgi:hypothetical protein